jgi:predicted GIY-YIG superfamily endonuclease
MELPYVLPTGQYAIYVLTGPADNLVYYVGKTCKPQRRFAQHLAARHHKGSKAAWLRRLEQQGQQPVMQILEIVKSEEAALAKEQEWIYHFLKKGMPILNAQTQPKANIEAIIPLRQKFIVLFGYPVIVVWLPDGRIAVSLTALCDMLKIAANGQARRIRRDETLCEQLLRVIVETPGGPQPAEVLTTWVIPHWLKGLRLNMISPEKRPMIFTLRREADILFSRPFFESDASEGAQPASAPTQKPPRSALEMHIEAWQAAKQKKEAREALLEARFEALEQRQTEIYAQLVFLEHRNSSGDI